MFLKRYPGSNPELVAAVSKHGGFGVVQPIALTHLYKHDYRKGLQLIKNLSGGNPFGVNITILPKTSASMKYVKMNEEFLDVALDEGVKFILTSLGKPNDIVKIAHEKGAKVYHDVHNKKLAMLAIEAANFSKSCGVPSLVRNRISFTQCSVQNGNLEGQKVIETS